VTAPDATRGNHQHTGNETGIDHSRIGVYTVCAEIAHDNEELGRIEQICSHNAEVCSMLGQLGKMETWLMVAKIVRHRMKNAGKGFDGWGGVEGGALGVGLLGNLLRYYELMGDVQMLSALVCVLRRKHKTTKYEKGRGCILLPRDQDVKYDLYIRRYADLLYGWGLLTTRAELIKHLFRTISPTESEGLEFNDGACESLASGCISLAFRCPRCAGSSEFGYCPSCKEYVFRCVICDNAVRGLFTVCSR
jgi:hypothetical protein